MLFRSTKAKSEATPTQDMMSLDLQVMTVIATIVEDPDTSQMSARHLPKKEMRHQEERIEEMSHLVERGVKKIDMNEDLLEEAMIRRGETSPPRDTQEEDPKLMLVNGYPAPTTNPREVITPTPTIVKMKVLPDLH